MSKLALVRPPSPRLAEGIVTHIDRSPVDVELAMRQWVEYVGALNEHGWTTYEVPAAPDCPDSAFVEDTMVVFRDVAVLARPGADERKPEVAAAAEGVRALGFRTVAIEAPGTLDGGDVLKVGNTIYVGHGGRTNPQGIAQLSAAFEPLGATIVTVPLSKVLHLKSAVTALPDGTIIGWEPVVDDVSLFPTFLAMPEEPGAHVVLLDDKHVLMSWDAPKSAALIRARGYEPVLVNISEYIKLEGCVTCLSVRLRDAPTVSFDVVPGSHKDAIFAMTRYFAELDARFDGGFEPGDTLTADAPSMTAPRGAFVVARSEGAVIGCGGVVRIDDRIAEIKRMWVDPNWRGIGLGKRLLANLESHAARLGFRLVRLDTNSVLVEAIAMYEHAGYYAIERYNDNPYARHWFEKRLVIAG